MTEKITDKEEKILKTFALIIPKLSESDKSYLLGLGDGIAAMKRSESTKATQGQPTCRA